MPLVFTRVRSLARSPIRPLNNTFMYVYALSADIPAGANFPARTTHRLVERVVVVTFVSSCVMFVWAMCHFEYRPLSFCRQWLCYLHLVWHALMSQKEISKGECTVLFCRVEKTKRRFRWCSYNYSRLVKLWYLVVKDILRTVIK